MAVTGINLLEFIADKLPATFTAPGLSEGEFLAICEQFPDAQIEYTEEGTILIMPPTDPDSGNRTLEVARQLGNWAVEKGGLVVGPDAGFFFPRGSRRSPDASWYNEARWREAKKSGLVFPVFAPEFVIEVRSPSDRKRTLRDKMREYMANGVQLAWLIDPFERTVEIYRPDGEPELLTNPTSVAGEGPVAGFVLALDRIFTA